MRSGGGGWWQRGNEYGIDGAGMGNDVQGSGSDGADLWEWWLGSDGCDTEVARGDPP